ncbi:MAG: universal stress protein [Propionibacteriaceae bacterium]|jgi:nucleotide-binding universal stress UspA family protein|nr:universal stress protein [Propionibacteriaceae bacterium]
MTELTASQTAGRIVVGFDDSPGATGALNYAADLAASRGLGLSVLSALAHLNPTDRRTARTLKVEPNYIETATAKANAQLATVVAQVRDTHPGLDVAPLLVAEEPAGALAAASRDAALVVVGARGRSSEKRLPLLGGTASDVITHSQGPVLVVPEGEHALSDGPVVIGLQDAPDSLAAAEIAAAEALLRGVTLVATYAWDIAPELGDFSAMVRIDPEQTHRDLDAMLQELIAPIVAAHPDLKVERRVVQGSARVALVEASRTASLLVIGSRGLGGFAGLLLGSVSRSVTREALCPVIVARDWQN